MAKRQAAVAAPAPAAGGDIEEYPKSKYRKVPQSKQYPNGYQVRRVESADEEQALGKEWVDSPADLPRKKAKPAAADEDEG